MIKEAEDLIRTVSELNDELLSEGRKRANQSVSEQAGIVIKELAASGLAEALMPAILSPLESLKGKVRIQESLAHLSQAEFEAVKMRDMALDKLEQELERREKEGRAIKNKPVSRPRRTVSPSKLVKKAYLENQNDVETFLKSPSRRINCCLGQE